MQSDAKPGTDVLERHLLIVMREYCQSLITILDSKAQSYSRNPGVEEQSAWKKLRSIVDLFDEISLQGQSSQSKSESRNETRSENEHSMGSYSIPGHSAKTFAFPTVIRGNAMQTQSAGSLQVEFFG